MKRWLIPAGGSAVLVIAAVIGMVVFASGGGTASCDRDALAAAVRGGIETAQDGDLQFTVPMPDGCEYEDLLMAAQEMTREWHAMPGGVIMREAQHTD